MARAETVLAAKLRDGSTTRLVKLCCANLAAIVFLQRIVVPLGGELGVSCLLPIAWFSMLYLSLAGLAFIDVVALLGFTAFAAAAVLSQIFGAANFSVTSLALLLTIYAIFPVRLLLTRADYRCILDFYQRCIVVIAVATLVQLGCQFLGWGMPLLENFVPDRLIVKNFVYLQEIVWESGIYKPNGVFMLEASFLSQFIALALVIEYWVFQRAGILLLFSFVLVLTFSGTGMSLAAVTLAVMVLKRGMDRNATILATALAFAFLGLLATGWLEAISGRVGEFSDRDASASVRFVAPLGRIYETIQQGDISTLIWGAGAGFIDREIGFAWNPPVKVWVEYGMVTFLAYSAFLLTLVRATPVPMLTIALGLEYLLFGGGALLQPPVVFACFFLGVGFSAMQQLSVPPPAMRSLFARREDIMELSRISENA